MTELNKQKEKSKYRKQEIYRLNEIIQKFEKKKNQNEINNADNPAVQKIKPRQQSVHLMKYSQPPPTMECRAETESDYDSDIEYYLDPDDEKKLIDAFVTYVTTNRYEEDHYN